jgi:hypothetical protein
MVQVVIGQTDLHFQKASPKVLRIQKMVYI